MSIRSILTTAGIVVVASVVFACDDDGETPSEGTGKDFCQKTLGVVADALDTCCSADDKATDDYGVVRGFLAFFLPSCQSSLEASISLGRVRYHPDKAEACYAAMRDNYGPDKCANIVQTFSDPSGMQCREAFSGVGAVDAPCKGNHECIDGLLCVGVSASAEGTCREPPALGEPCGTTQDSDGIGGPIEFEFGSHPECAGGAACDPFERRCVQAVKAGDACTSTFDCGESLRCVAGTCSDAQPGGVGADCDSELDCTPDAFCAPDPMNSNQGKCAKKRNAGEPCTGNSFVTECLGRCDAPSGQAGTCVSFCGSP